LNKKNKNLQRIPPVPAPGESLRSTRSAGFCVQ